MDFSIPIRPTISLRSYLSGASSGQAGGLIGLVPLLVQGGQLILLNLAGIADDRGKIDAVLILAHIGLLHRNAPLSPRRLIDFHLVSLLILVATVVVSYFWYSVSFMV